MKPCKDAVLPRMIGGTVLGQDDLAGSIVDWVEVRASARFHHESGKVDPILLRRQLRSDDDSFLTGFHFEPTGGLRWRLCGWDFRRAGNEFRSGVHWRFVEREKSEEVRQILFVEQPLDSFGHHREFAHARVLY